MKKKRKGRMLTEHAKKRLKERVQYPIAIESITKAIKTKTLLPIKRESISRTIYYGMVENCPIKLVYSKTLKKIITILPLEYDYSFNFITQLNDYIYSITIFPDCYIETENPSMLTVFKKFDNLLCNWGLCKKSTKENFHDIFSLAWEGYKKFRGEKQHAEIKTYQESCKFKCYQT
jgi:hypothetical protein